MGLKPDHWIRKMALESKMIEPFVENQVRQGVISYGVSSYGYDMRVADEFKIFTNVYSAIVDPKNFSPQSFVDFKGDVCIIPPNSFALATSVEYFRIPQADHECVNEKLVGLSKMKWHDPCCQLLPLHYLRVLLSSTTSYSSCDQRACALLSHPHVA